MPANNEPTDATGVPLTHERAMAMLKRAPRGTRARHDAAYRDRQGMIGVLASCICTYPLDIDPTTKSGHDPRCPSEGLAKSMAEIKAAHR